MQASLSDSELATSSSSSNASSINVTPEESDDYEESAKITLSSPLLQKHKPSWGEIPTPTSLNGSTSFSFGQNPSSSISATTNTATTHSILKNDGQMDSTEGRMLILGNGEFEEGGEASSGSSTPTPKAERANPIKSAAIAQVTAKNTDANANASPTALRVLQLQNEFVDAQPQMMRNGGEPACLSVLIAPFSRSARKEMRSPAFF